MTPFLTEIGGDNLPKKNINYKELFESLRRYLTKQVVKQKKHLEQMTGLLAYECVLAVMNYQETVILSTHNDREKKKIEH